METLVAAPTQQQEGNDDRQGDCCPAHAVPQRKGQQREPDDLQNRGLESVERKATGQRV